MTTQRAASRTTNPSPARDLRLRAQAATAVVLTAATLAMTACAPDNEDAAAAPSSPVSAAASGNANIRNAPTGQPAVVASDLDAPWSLVFRNDVALVSERDSGRILEVGDDGRTSVVGTVADVQASGEGGLLGMAVDRSGRLFVYSTGSSGNRIERYDLTGQPGSLRLGASTTIIDNLPSTSYHDGGRIAFGPDGMLYAGVGDAGQRDLAQDRRALNGKILRMTPDGQVPADNPFRGSLVYSLGHRNVQGLAWTSEGSMYEVTGRSMAFMRQLRTEAFDRAGVPIRRHEGRAPGTGGRHRPAAGENRGRRLRRPKSPRAQTSPRGGSHGPGRQSAAQRIQLAA